MRLVVEADGGSRGNPGAAGYGALVRDGGSGEVLAERAASIGTASNNVAEYRGLIAGLAAARELDPAADVEVRMDSKLVVEQMSGRWQVKHPAMRDLVRQAHAARPSGRVTYTWVPRAQNAAADRLANEAMDAAAAGRAWEPSGLPAPSGPGAVVDEAEVEPPAVDADIGWAADLGTPTTLLLLRHGDTRYTREKRFSGAGGDDPGLTDRGRVQARAFAAAFAAVVAGGSPAVSAIVASPLRRTRETAHLVAAALGLPVGEDPDLRECDFGEWDGCSFAEVSQRWPAELAAWLESPTVVPPGGESFDAVGARVRVARDRVLARYVGRRVLLVTHVTPIKQLVRFALDAPPHALFRMELSSASLTTLDWYAGGTASLRSFNDTSHLGALP